MISQDALPNTENINVDNLSYAAIRLGSEEVNWRQLGVEGFQYWEATYSRNDENKAVLYPDDLNQVDHLHELCPGPMMNFAYEIPDTMTYGPSEAATRIYDLPLCVTRLEQKDGFYLALTGGGMNMSWPICESYMRLGFYPPTEFADLPRMAGRGESDRDKNIIAACEEAIEGRKEQAQRSLDRLQQVAA